MAKKALFCAVAVFVGAVLMLVVLYGFEFLFSPYGRLPSNGKIGGERYTWGHHVKNNRYGFRERDFASPKPAGAYRVMVLGDSFTWGAGLAVQERYTAVAERLLNQTAAGLAFEVLNFGTPGDPTTVERDILLEHRDVVDPDLIVVGFCFNDPKPTRQNYSIERERLEESSARRRVARVQGYLRAARLPYVSDLVGNAFFATAEMAGVIPTWQAALQRSYEPSSDDWQDFVQSLRDIRRMSDELHLPQPIFAVLNHGRRSSDYENPGRYLKQLLAWNRQAERAARDVGFLAYNHEHEILRQLDDEIMHVNRLDDHPAANLNLVYGRKLYRKIMELVEPREPSGRGEGSRDG